MPVGNLREPERSGSFFIPLSFNFFGFYPFGFLGGLKYIANRGHNNLLILHISRSICYLSEHTRNKDSQVLYVTNPAFSCDIS